MSMLETELSRPGYRNWLKAGLCLDFLKKGLCPFVISESESLHNRVLEFVEDHRLRQGIPLPLKECKTCNKEGIFWDFKSKKWMIKSIHPSTDQEVYYCPNYVCHAFIDAIQNEHVSPEPRGMYWRNCNLTAWQTSHWEVSKALLDKMDDGINKAMPQDADCSSLLKFIENCKSCHEEGKISMQLVVDVRHQRNNIVHLAKTEMMSDELQRFAKDAVGLLSSLKNYNTCEEAVRAVENIKKTLDAEVIPSVNEEVHALKVAQRELQQQMNVLQELKDRISYLEQSLKDRHITETCSDEELKKFKDILITAYEETYSSVSLSPLSREQKVPLDQVYSDMILVKDIKKEKEKNSDIKGRREAEIAVSRYHDVFYKENERLKSVYLLGEAGAGKTVYSIRMTQTWAKVHKTVESRTLTPDESTMKAFQFLFYVPLKHIKKSPSLRDAVLKSMDGIANYEKVVKYLFKNRPEEILVICDGLDEIKGSIPIPQLHQYTLFSTTRPWKFSSIQYQDLKIDRILKVKGLDETGVSNLVRVILQSSLHEESSELVDRVLGDIKSAMPNETVMIPLIVICFVHLRLQQTKLSETKTNNIADVVELVIQRGHDKVTSGSTPKRFKRDLSASEYKLACFSEKPMFKLYGRLIERTAKLALDSLTDSIKEQTLVFSEVTLKKYFPSQDFQTCLEIGILSKTEELRSSYKTHTLSFLHKFIHEFFAALDIVNNEASYKKFCEYCSSIDNIVEMENVFMFVCGLCACTGSRLSKHIMERCSFQPEIQAFRTNIFTDHDDILRDLTHMYLKCATEIRDDCCELYIEDMCLQNIDVCALVKLFQFNASRLVGIFMYIDEEITSNDVVTLLEQLQKVKTLRKFAFGFLQGTECTMQMIEKLNSILDSNTSMKVLALGHETQTIAGIRLQQQSLSQLEHLGLETYPTTGQFLDQLMDIIKNGELRLLGLMGTDTGNHVFDLSPLHYLSNLQIWNTAMSVNAWVILLESLNELTSLENLKLCNNSLSTETTIVHLDSINIDFIERLKTLYLWDKNTDFVISQVIQRKLHSAVSLVTLDIYCNTKNTQCSTFVAHALPCLQELQELVLWNFDFLAEKFNVEYNVKLAKVEFWEVRMSSSAWNNLFLSLHVLKDLSELDFKSISNNDVEDRVQYNLPLQSTVQVIQHEHRKITLKCKFVKT